MYTRCEQTFVKINMNDLKLLIKQKGFNVSSFMDLLGYSRRTWYEWKKQGGVSTNAFVKIAFLFNWFDLPENIQIEIITNRT